MSLANATGPLSLPVTLMGRLVAATPSFQAWCGATAAFALLTTEQKALTSIYAMALPFIHEGEAPADAPFPSVIVDMALGNGLSGTRLGASSGMNWNGTCLLRVQDATGSIADYTDFQISRRLFFNRIGDVINDMCDASGRLDTIAGNRLPYIRNASVSVAPIVENDDGRVTDPDDESESKNTFWHTELMLDWGLA